MKKFIYTIIFMALLGSLNFGCAPFDDSPEARVRRHNQQERARRDKIRRLQKQQHDQKIKNENNITSLSGLNATELNAIKTMRSETKSSGEEFVFSRKSASPTHPVLNNELNDYTKDQIKTYKKSQDEHSQVGKSWVYGF